MNQQLVTKSKDIISMGVEGLSEYNLGEITMVASAVNIADKMVKLAQGIILVSARSKHADDISFGKYRENIFPDLDNNVASKLMNLARFFTPDRPMNEIKYSAALIISAPKNRDIAERVYDKVKSVAGGASIKKVNEVIEEMDMEKVELPNNSSPFLGETLSEVIERDIIEEEKNETKEQKLKQKENRKKESLIEDPIEKTTPNLPALSPTMERQELDNEFKDKINGVLSIERALLVFGIHNEAAFIRNDPLLGGHIEAIQSYYKAAYHPDNAGDSLRFSMVDKAAKVIRKHYNV